MVDVNFMHEKFSVAELVDHYLEEIKNLRQMVQSPTDESKLQSYYQAASTFKRVTIKELVQFALSYGKDAHGKAAQMQSAFSVVLGNRVQQPTPVDLAYAKILLAYTQAFKENRSHLKEWMLRFIISSRFSPVAALVEREINHVLANTQHNIASFETIIRK